ncbi:AEC family transporter [Nakamurella leprariae]|uniref:AEC family transporter n=1 Tax=Nakamurella leprariae TaxID=2803911 RepID=A0A938YDT5_9ACTN|nr:AEC family transporter [Nakamurella leprariae]MBM9466025.1 AEC family transporter [Nakamurella leprariae]
MLSVLAGIASLAIVIAIGFLLARFRVMPERTPEVLSRLVFLVATPVLLVRTLAGTDVATVLSTPLAVTGVSTSVTGLTCGLIARLALRRSTAESTIAGVASCYVNAVNLGVPLTVQVFGTAEHVVPVLFWQIVVLAPITFVLLDTARSGIGGDGRVAALRAAGRVVARTARNPLLIATALGLVLSLLDWRLPSVIDEPLALIGGLAVPGALLAFGMSLVGGVPGERSARPADVALTLTGKLALLPVVTWVVAQFGFGLTGADLLAVTVCAALPTAQNVFVFAMQYRAAVPLARAAVALSTVGCVPVFLLILALLGP